MRIFPNLVLLYILRPDHPNWTPRLGAGIPRGTGGNFRYLHDAGIPHSIIFVQKLCDTDHDLASGFPWPELLPHRKADHQPGELCDRVGHEPYLCALPSFGHLQPRDALAQDVQQRAHH